MPQLKFYQRQFFIQKDFQAKFILLYLLAVLLIVGLSSWFLFGQIKTAVNKHLYSTHMKVDQVGDFLANLLFSANFISVLAIVLTVLTLSLLVFNRINRKFSQLDAVITKMGQGDFGSTRLVPSRILEVGELTKVVEQTRQNSQERYVALDNALSELEHGCASADLGQIETGKKQLDAVLVEISLK
jgi:methyl-accepting chemotaxis protein